MKSLVYLFLIIAIIISYPISALSQKNLTLKGKVERIDYGSKTITVAGKIIEAPNLKYDSKLVNGKLLATGLTSDVEIDDEISVTYDIVNNKNILKSFKNYTRPKKEEDNNTLLLKACANGDYEKVISLINNGANANTKDMNNRTPLIFASARGSLKIVSFLTNKGAEINIKDNDGRSALFYAATAGKIEIVKILYNNNAEINYKDNTETSPIMCAKINNHNEIVQFFIDNGVEDVDVSKLVVRCPYSIMVKQ